MSGFYDIHSHVLPQIDDGAKNMEMSMEMIGSAYEQGVRHLIATSHFSVEGRKDESYYRNYQKEIESAFDAVKMTAEKLYPDMHLYLGNELLYTSGFAKALQKGWIHSLNDSRYLLVEFYPSTPLNELENALREIMNRGFVPVLAHVERYECLWKKDKILDDIRDLGVVIQMNVSSVLGNMFSESTRVCRRWVKQGFIDVLGTDMHNMRDRKPRYDEAFAWIQKNCDEDTIWYLTEENPRCIIENKPIN